MINIKQIIEDILIEATSLKDRHTKETDIRATWACIFCQSDEEYKELITQADKLGTKYKDTYSGPIYHLNEPIGSTVRILKIRQRDPKWKERGDADFTVSDYVSFKREYLAKDGFKLIPRDGFEMIELMESCASVRAYFSNPSVEEQYQDVLN